MPIPIEMFRELPHKPANSLGQAALEFLRSNPGLAYTLQEILEALGARGMSAMTDRLPKELEDYGDSVIAVRYVGKTAYYYKNRSND